ncbi:MAG: hypothetical protein J0J10_12545 [Bosea sp.]|uniref:hypothetical protein n=1 Tax=Bosea sp. (in: a-proteobacteria) TaxID=1871050 RepID=UPI001AC18076|nr:hypothetical protein [Bosea sp. (in: a-proteobacteria)]MBN9469594.1 hypothetical protein [Bosea sp. (in: a-proteobacteria)]
MNDQMGPKAGGVFAPNPMLLVFLDLSIEEIDCKPPGVAEITGAMVAIPKAPLLFQVRSRRNGIYAAPRGEQKLTPVRHIEMISDERDSTPFKPDDYRYIFFAIRDAAAYGMAKLVGRQRVVLRQGDRAAQALSVDRAQPDTGRGDETG